MNTNILLGGPSSAVQMGPALTRRDWVPPTRWLWRVEAG